jgi:hypothetical protein
MKKLGLICLTAASILVIMLIASCDLGGVSADQRVSRFLSDLNSSSNPRPHLYADFDDSTATYASGPVENTWNSTELQISPVNYQPFTLTITSGAGTSHQVGTLHNTGGVGNMTVTINLVKNGSDWFILNLDDGVDAVWN